MAASDQNCFHPYFVPAKNFTELLLVFVSSVKKFLEREQEGEKKSGVNGFWRKMKRKTKSEASRKGCGGKRDRAGERGQEGRVPQCRGKGLSYP